MNEPLKINTAFDAETARKAYEQFTRLYADDDSPTVLMPFKKNALPEIVDFDIIYQSSNDEKQEHVVSIMKFADGTQTKCIIDISEGTDSVPDDYTAFLTCYCKKILGADFHKTWKYWTEKKPDQEWKNWLKECEELKEQERLEESRRKRRERKRFKRMVKQKELELRAEREARKRLDSSAI